jgi:hypothetical protein
MTRNETIEAAEVKLSAARRALHLAAALYTPDGAGTKTQADLEALAVAFSDALYNYHRAIGYVEAR